MLASSVSQISLSSVLLKRTLEICVTFGYHMFIEYLLCVSDTLKNWAITVEKKNSSHVVYTWG